MTPALAAPRRKVPDIWAPSVADRLRRLAREVEQLGRGRETPEEALLRKWNVVRELHRLASEAEA